MSEINKRTPRASETRSKTERRKPWRPASSLEAPQPPEGYKFRWVRTEVRGHEDRKNVSGRIREGYDCLLYTSDAADDMQCVDLGGRRII